MNPGYAGRTELPDNLKSMFRPISMCVPDSNYIAEIILFGEGFNNTRALAKKVYTLYQLATQQLSKQDHYDFGLRALSSVLRHAGKKKRANPTMSDEEILLLAMRDMNIPKMTTVDLPLFNGIVSDLFPGIEPPQIDYSKFKKAIEEELKADNKQVNFNAINKIIQLYETKNSRHSVMLVGRTQSGKTITWQGLKKCLTRLHREGEQGYQKAQEYTINPKAVSLGELYGEFDLSTGEWSDGILSSVMRTCCADEKPDEKWIFFDSPVDAVWIESMNSVMDDNKILTLINSERIAMPEQVSLLFETEDLAVASPATVSRCGMVYFDYLDLGWQSHIDSWIASKKQKEVQDELKNLINKYIKPILNFKKLNCKELVPIAELNGIKSMCNLFDSFGTKENGIDPQGEEFFSRMIEMWFLFCVIWSIGASVDEDGRKKLDAFIRELEGTFPNKDTIYEYYVDTKQRTWVQWEEKLRSGWKYNPEIPFYKIIVPTVDTIRYNYLVSSLIKNQRPVLLTGPVGTGKTSVAQSVLNELDPMEYSVLVINISAQTSSNNVQEIIEARVEKRTKGVYVPLGGKKLLNFMDDFNMPAKDEYGSQPPLELMRLWLDYGFWYDRKKQTTKYIKDVFLMAAMGPPGGGRTVISRRLQSRFNLINMTFPQENEVNRIFGSMINQKLQDFDDEFKSLGDLMTKATVQMYEAVVQKFLPTPTKIHYLFNLRDISKVFQGLLRCDKRLHSSKPTLIRLWIHECFRVFYDRLVDDKDRDLFISILSENLGSYFDQTYHNICANKQPPIFGNLFYLFLVIYFKIFNILFILIIK
jgi:dynein heavy chain